MAKIVQCRPIAPMQTAIYPLAVGRQETKFLCKLKTIFPRLLSLISIFPNMLVATNIGNFVVLPREATQLSIHTIG